jgi:DNA-binding transcriptional MerR regulator
LFEVLYSERVGEREEGHLRIGELSQRTGVSPELLRAWERRYGLLHPSRSAGGFRLYTTDDEERVRRMLDHLGRGIAAAEAARLADKAPEQDSEGWTLIEALARELQESLDRFDDVGGQRCLDAALGTFSVDRVVADLLLPYLRELGERWERGEVNVAQEHFASNLIRSRLLGLARGWDAGYGPRVILACPEGELHDLGLVMFGVALRQRGWRVTFLGANTPIAMLAAAAEELDPDAIVLAATDLRFLDREREALSPLAAAHRLFIAGPGADGIADDIGAELFDVDPVTASERLAAAAL